MPLDQQLLPNPELARYYGKIVWLFVSRNFNGDDKDLEALRTHDRFGISSWPQMIVFDPRDDRVLLDPPRDLSGFVRAFDRALRQHGENGAAADATADHAAQALAAACQQHAGGDTTAALAALRPLIDARDTAGVWLEARRLQREWSGEAPPAPLRRLDDPDPRERALALEAVAAEIAPPAPSKSGQRARPETATTAPPPPPRLDDAIRDRALALLLHDGEDVVVRTRALRLLAKGASAAVLPHAAALLAVPNDPFRYEVLDLLQQHPAPALGALLADLFRDAGRKVPSRNPNVLRMRTVTCLAESGDAKAIDVVAPIAREARWRYAGTKLVLQTLGRLAERLPDERARIASVLLESFPAAATDDRTDRRASLALAQDVRDALVRATPGLQAPALPEVWDEPGRERFMAALREAMPAATSTDKR